MKQGLILLLAVCTLAATMVPRDRRAVNTEEEEEQLRSESESTTSITTIPKQICAPQTPCAWFIYRPISKYVILNITNSYCECSADTVCTYNEDNLSTNAFVYRCRPPTEPEPDTES